MITDEDYRALQINCQRMEREMKAMRQTLLDDFAKAALIGYLSCEASYIPYGSFQDYAETAFDYAEAMMQEREKRYGTR